MGLGELACRNRIGNDRIKKGWILAQESYPTAAVFVSNKQQTIGTIIRAEERYRLS
jgi:hypothetical protein